MSSTLLGNFHLATGGSENGPAVLLLHGVTRQIADLKPIIDRLPAHVGWIAVDFPGHGESTPARHGYKVRDYCDDLTRLLSSLPIRPLILFGHSLGAMVAAHVAAMAPKRVVGAILEDPPFSTMGDRIKATSFYLQFEGLKSLYWGCLFCKDFERNLLAGLRDLPVIRASDGAKVRMSEVRSEQAIQTYASYLSQIDPLVLDPIVNAEWLDGYDMPAIASKVSCPTLLFQADEKWGGMLTDQEAAQFASTAPNCTLKKITGAPHLIHATHLDLLASEINSFLKSILQPSN